VVWYVMPGGNCTVIDQRRLCVDEYLQRNGRGIYAITKEVISRFEDRWVRMHSCQEYAAI
jgi:hypothetical protein